MLRARAMAALPLFSFVNPNFCKPFYLSFPSPDLRLRPLKSINSPKALSISSSSTPLQSPLSPIPNRDLAPYLSCSMPGKCLRIAVLLSGGVDSSVALRLLHAAGHSCTAFYLKIWFQAWLSRIFEMKDPRVAKKIPDIDIHRDREINRLWLSQMEYLEKVLLKFRMDKAKPVRIHHTAHFRISL